jgi:hypothetical protein
VSFKHFLAEEITVKSPKPNKINFTINSKHYIEFFENSIIPQKKTILERLHNGKGEIPVFCLELQKFFMIELSQKKLKARELKSREDKEYAGALLNGIIVSENKKGHVNVVNALCEMNAGWDVPSLVYTVKNEFGKNVNLRES